MFLRRVVRTASICSHNRQQRIIVWRLLQPQQVGTKRLTNYRRDRPPLERGNLTHLRSQFVVNIQLSSHHGASIRRRHGKGSAGTNHAQETVAASAFAKKANEFTPIRSILAS